MGDAPLTGNYSAIINGDPNTPLGPGPIVVASFTDANPNAPASAFTATIVWGDGTTDTASAAAGTLVADPSPLQITPYNPATPLSTLTNALMKPGTGLNLVSANTLTLQFTADPNVTSIQFQFV